MRKEHSTRDLELPPPSLIKLPDEGDIDHENIVVALDSDNKYMQDLAFNEEPVTIMIDYSDDEYPPAAVDAWVNGFSPEILANGRWYRKPAIPVGCEVTVKRKYVEVLMRAKPETVRTEHGTSQEERPQNNVRRTPRSAYNLTVIEDNNPAGREWRTRIKREGG